MSGSNGSEDDSSSPTTSPTPLPKGVVLGPDGKPCRTCTDTSSWKALMKKSAVAGATASKAAPRTDCPPDVEQLGRSTWTLLHSIAAQYPIKPTIEEQKNATTFITSFSKLYPCWTCADDFRTWLKKDGNAPRVSSRHDFGQWLCEAHNEVNVKLGKKPFDCSRWEERWKTGWKNGSCD